MATWDTPMIKFEGSPTESLLSAPPDMYTSLFSPGTPGTPGTLDPSEILSPRATPEASHAATQAGMTTPGPTTTSAATPAASSPGASTPGADSTSEKKSTKKRKSWGQILPEPKTNLPPRKRAKTEDEKEQRRVERVLRNRRAAQSSRERKRLEVEALEKKNKELEAALNHAQQANARLMEELAKMQRDSGVMPRSSAPLDFSASNNSMTLLPELFGSPDGRRPSADSAISLVDDLLKITQSNATVNPASLSPALSPAPQADEIEIHEDADAIKTEPIDVSSDLTQRPAAMLCDLQCHQSEERPETRPISQTTTWALYLHLHLLMITSSAIISACQRPLMQIALSLKAGFSLPPNQSIMTTIIWLVTRPSSRSTRSTSTTSSTTRSTRQLSPQTRQQRSARRTRSWATTPLTLRLKSLQKILTCSPTLARPLMDATMEALRLVSEGFEDRVGGMGAAWPVTRGDSQPTLTWLDGTPFPSREVLLTLLWTLRVEERKMMRQGILPDPHPETKAHTPTGSVVLLTSTKAPTKRKKNVSAA